MNSDHLIADGDRVDFEIIEMKGVTNLVVAQALRYAGESDDCELLLIDEQEYIPLFVEERGASFSLQSTDRSRTRRFDKVN